MRIQCLLFQSFLISYYELPIELPLLAWKSLRSEVAFINWYDEEILIHELSQKSWYPLSLFIVGRILVLHIGWLGLPIAKMELLSQYLPKHWVARHSESMCGFALLLLSFKKHSQLISCNVVYAIELDETFNGLQQMKVISICAQRLSCWLVVRLRELLQFSFELLNTGIHMIRRYSKLLCYCWRFHSFLEIHIIQKHLLSMLLLLAFLHSCPRLHICLHSQLDLSGRNQKVIQLWGN